MQNLRVIASESYISFLCVTGDEGSFGCLLPRNDSQVFVEKIEQILKKEENFPEVDFEVGCMLIETMSAGLNIMFQCTDLQKEKAIQFALEFDMCKELLAKLKEVENNIAKHYGPPPESKKAWHFFIQTEEEAEISQNSL